MVLDYLVGEYEKPAGVIASAPALGTPGVSPAVLFLARLMSRIVPRFSMDTGLETQNLSRDASVIEAYQSDPLVHGKGTARLATELTRAQQRIFDRIGTSDVPILLAYGDSDRIAPRAPIERLLAEAGTDDKRLEVFAGGFHEPHWDLQREEVFALYADWILERV
jgi:alpha-beta hydrolase superfamily lysophospholipase